MLKKYSNPMRYLKFARYWSKRLPFQLAQFGFRIYRRPTWYTDRYGVTCRLYPGDHIWWILAGRSHFNETGTLRLLERCLKPGMLIVDVGAAKGAFTLFVAQRIGPNGKVHAFEPATYTFRRLSENVEHSPDLAKLITLNRQAVFSRPGEVQLNLFPPALSDWNTLGTPRMYLRRGKTLSPVQSETVPAVTLDTYCAQHDISNIDLLKIDVEGFEIEVIEGAHDLLHEHRIASIVFEISVGPLAGTNHTARQVLERFASYDLNVSLINPTGELLPVRDPATFNIPEYANYLAQPRARGAAV